jgi:nicotinate-nucleotide adenylyltransferase
MGIKKIGLLGGSFDPVHLVHIALAETARKHLALDELQLIPAANPWQRQPLAASPEHRLAMLELAIAAKPGLCINSIEIERGGKTYTMDTLEQLPQDNQYFWILGADQLANICSWHRWEEIAGFVCLAVAERPGDNSQAPIPLQLLLEKAGKSLTRLPFEASPVSASDIRRRLAEGLPVDGMLDGAVTQYIRQHGLYRATAA